MKRFCLLAACAAGLIAASTPVSPAHGFSFLGDGITQVLLISVDGMHNVDFLNCSKGISTVNKGAPYCPNLNSLAKNGAVFSDATIEGPSYPLQGLVALVTGGSPRTTGVYSEVAYDRSLAPPKVTTGNGLLGGTCTPNVNNGTSTEYDEGIDINQTLLNGGAPSGEGGVNSINSLRLVRNPFAGCVAVWPWNFVRQNTTFSAVYRAGGYTAWEDDHPADIAIAGIGTPTSVNDFYAPEISSNTANFIPLPNMTVQACSPLPDQAAVAAGDSYRGSFQDIQCYDSLKVQGIINQIDGLTHDGSAPAPVPNLFGMSFQSVDVGQRLVYQDAPTVPAGYSTAGGYLDALGTPSPSLFREIKYVDMSIGLMISELQKQNLVSTTLIVVTAKHGQSPIDPLRYLPVPGHSPLNNGDPPSAILGGTYLPASELRQPGPTESDVSLLWLSPDASASNALEVLGTSENETLAGIGEIFAGSTLSSLYNIPGSATGDDPRTPDIIIAPNPGVTYTTSGSKLAERGGFSHDDNNVILLLSNPSLTTKTLTMPVTTTQVAATIVSALGLNPVILGSVRQEQTPDLYGLPYTDKPLGTPTATVTPISSLTRTATPTKNSD